MYGANNEEFTFLEMSEFLKSKNIIKNSVELYTLGGDADRGINFDEDIKRDLMVRLKDIHIQRLEFKSLNDNIEKRIAYYERYPNPKYFINIGGNLVSSRLEKYYKSLAIPTLTMLNIKQLAIANGISNVKDSDGLYGESQNIIYYLIIIFAFMLYILLKIFIKPSN